MKVESKFELSFSEEQRLSMHFEKEHKFIPKVPMEGKELKSDACAQSTFQKLCTDNES